MDQRFVHIVDDDPPVRESLRWLLSSVDIEAVTYDTSEAFLVATAGQPEGCVLLDMRMPGIDGVAVLRRLASNGMTAPVIVMSGHGSHADAAEVLGLGAAGFIEKPFAAERLLAIVAQLLVARTH